MQKNKMIRLIIEDQEEVVFWDEDVTKDQLYQLVMYITEDIRQLYKANELSYKNYAGSAVKLDLIVADSMSPVFISVPNKLDVKTEHKVDSRRFKNLYIFTNKNMLRIQRFDGVRRFEEAHMTIEELIATNQESARMKFEEPKPQSTPKLKIEVVQPQNENKQEKKRDSVKATQSSHDNKSQHLQKEEHKQNNTRSKSPGLRLDVHNNGHSASTSGGDSGTLKINTGGAYRSEGKKNMVGHGSSPAGFMAESKNVKSPLEEGGLKVYNMEEISKHNTTRDGWMVLNGKVYDVTKYLAYHPGGSVINKGLGKDATVLFNQYHSWVNADYILKKYQIGTYKKY